MSSFNSKEIFDLLSEKIDRFLNSGIGDYNEIIESIRSFQFSGDLTDSEAESLVMRLPDIDDFELGEKNDNAFSDVDFEEEDDSDLISDEDLFEDEEEKDPFASAEYEEDDSPIEDIEYFEDKKAEGFNLEYGDDFIESYKNEDEDYYDDGDDENKKSGFNDFEEEEPMPDYDFSNLFEEKKQKKSSGGFGGIF